MGGCEWGAKEMGTAAQFLSFGVDGNIDFFNMIKDFFSHKR